MTLWLVRHAQPLVAAGICYGQLDLPADVEHTQACALKLAAALPAQLRIFCSPLQRCEQLIACLLALRPDLTSKADARLQEMNFGCWEGRAWSAISPAELQAWTDDFAHYKPGSDSDIDRSVDVGESVSSFMARVASAFDELRQDADTLWITHAGVIRAASLIAGGTRQLDDAGQWPLAAPAYGQWCKLPLQPGNTDGTQS